MGWKTVPPRLTQDMADAAKGVDGRLSVWKYDDVYKAMLANAPDAPVSPEVAQLQARVAELEGALAALELAANTVSACYSRNPANFASALSNLGDYAASARVLLGAST